MSGDESASIGVYSIDDHEIIHTGIARLTEQEPDFDFLGATGDTSIAVAQVVTLRPHIVLLDLFIGDEPGWDVCRELSAAAPGVHVVIYSGHGNAQLLDRALNLGVSGYILKSAGIAGLPRMLRTVVATGQFIDPPLLREWINTRRDRNSNNIFSDQELAIVRMIAEGLDNHDIAARTHLSFHTVKFHIGKMLKRTREPNRAGLVRFAKENYLID